MSCLKSRLEFNNSRQSCWLWCVFINLSHFIELKLRRFFFNQITVKTWNMWLALSLGWQMAKCDRKLAQILSKKLGFFLTLLICCFSSMLSFWFYMRAADKNVLTRCKYEYWNRFVIIKAFFIDINVSWFWEFLSHGTKSWIFSAKST